ncbi:MAG TPA: hypothetical protein VMF56_03445 [Acidobacteriaceae bacterium]|nr:hypothetical protein [Acidobacteriaceae bacterium]
MSTVEWARNAMLLCIVASLVVVRWSAIRMAHEVNRVAPDGERISTKWWWPNYMDRRVLKRYRLTIPHGRLHLLYIGFMAGAFAFLMVGILLGAHSA